MRGAIAHGKVLRRAPNTYAMLGCCLAECDLLAEFKKFV
jgi:hypothetical protein